MICNDLIKHGFLRAISGGAKFTSSQYYQWKKESFDSELPHIKAKKEAERFETEYKKQALECDGSRLTFEQYCIDFMNRQQHLHHNRLEMLRRSLGMYCNEQYRTIDAAKNMCERISLLLETFQPAKEVQLFIERDRTGTARLPPVLGIDYYRGTHDFVFGVPLEDLAHRGQKVPTIINKCLSLILSEAFRLAAENEEAAEIDLW